MSLDPEGTDFIAVGTRRVKDLASIGLPNLGILGGHMSIEYWEECGPQNEDGQHFVSEPRYPASHDESRNFQLMSSNFAPDFDGDQSYYLWKWSVGGQGKSGKTGRWYWMSQSISIIYPTSNARRRVIIYSDKSDGDSDTMWVGAIDPAAKSYPWAEQGPKPPHPAQHYPNSIYQPTGNNGNTFVRYLAGLIGKDADIIGGVHMGNESPQPIGPSDIWSYSGTPDSYENRSPEPSSPPTPPVTR